MSQFGYWGEGQKCQFYPLKVSIDTKLGVIDTNKVLNDTFGKLILQSLLFLTNSNNCSKVSLDNFLVSKYHQSCHLTLERYHFTFQNDTFGVSNCTLTPYSAHLKTHFWHSNFFKCGFVKAGHIWSIISNLVDFWPCAQFHYCLGNISKEKLSIYV